MQEVELGAGIREFVWDTDGIGTFRGEAVCHGASRHARTPHEKPASPNPALGPASFCSPVDFKVPAAWLPLSGWESRLPTPRALPDNLGPGWFWHTLGAAVTPAPMVSLLLPLGPGPSLPWRSQSRPSAPSWQAAEQRPGQGRRRGQEAGPAP